MHDDREDHAAQAEHRADRQIYTAGDDHDRHAQRDHRDKGEVAGDVENVVRGCERIGRKRQEDTGNAYREQDPECLTRCQPGEKRKSCALDLIVELNIHRSNFRFSEKSPGRCHHHNTCSIAPVISPVTSSGELAVTALSATLRPRRSTTTRSAMLNTSGIRWLISTIAMPRSRSRRIRFSTWATCRTEMAAVASSL